MPVTNEFISTELALKKKSSETNWNYASIRLSA